VKFAGLRTLCVATTTISPDFYETWKTVYYEASTAIHDRERKLEEAAELVEKVSAVSSLVALEYLVTVNCWTGVKFHKMVSISLKENLKLVVCAASLLFCN